MSTPPHGSPLIDVERLLAVLGKPGWHLLDARFDLADPAAGERAWRLQRLPGAQYLDLDCDLSDHSQAATAGRHPLPSPEALRHRLEQAGIGPRDRVVVYDAGTGALAAARAWWLLRWIGVDHACVLDGGWAAWQAAGAPLEQGEPRRVAGRIDPLTEAAAWGEVQQAWCVDRLAVQSRHSDELLVDARSAERFRGDVEPLDRRAGHIPGASNRPWTDNLDGGRFKPAAELAKEWQALLAGRDPARVILSCGSGVTACHHALAMLQAGLPMPRLFAPSWSGWIADPQAPLATGPD